MGRYTEAVCRLCRREGLKLYLKGEKCYTDKCPVAKRGSPPGMHPASRRKPSEFGIRLREKQKLRRFYGVYERQFRNYFDVAAKSKAVTGTRLLQLLETRLDNIAYRLGLGTSRKEARQLVSHGHVTVNGRRVTVPSYRVRAGQAVAVADAARAFPHVKQVQEGGPARSVPGWLEFDHAALRGRVLAEPSRDEIDVPIQEQLIVEYYSR